MTDDSCKPDVVGLRPNDNCFNDIPPEMHLLTGASEIKASLPAKTIPAEKLTQDSFGLLFRRSHNWSPLIWSTLFASLSVLACWWLNKSDASKWLFLPLILYFGCYVRILGHYGERLQCGRVWIIFEPDRLFVVQKGFFLHRRKSIARDELDGVVQWKPVGLVWQEALRLKDGKDIPLLFAENNKDTGTWLGEVVARWAGVKFTCFGRADIA